MVDFWREEELEWIDNHLAEIERAALGNDSLELLFGEAENSFGGDFSYRLIFCLAYLLDGAKAFSKLLSIHQSSSYKRIKLVVNLRSGRRLDLIVFKSYSVTSDLQMEKDLYDRMMDMGGWPSIREVIRDVVYNSEWEHKVSV